MPNNDDDDDDESAISAVDEFLLKDTKLFTASAFRNPHLRSGNTVIAAKRCTVVMLKFMVNFCKLISENLHEGPTFLPNRA